MGFILGSSLFGLLVLITPEPQVETILVFLSFTVGVLLLLWNRYQLVTNIAPDNNIHPAIASVPQNPILASTLHSTNLEFQLSDNTESALDIHQHLYPDECPPKLLVFFYNEGRHSLSINRILVNAYGAGHFSGVCAKDKIIKTFTYNKIDGNVKLPDTGELCTAKQLKKVLKGEPVTLGVNALKTKRKTLKNSYKNKTSEASIYKSQKHSYVSVDDDDNNDHLHPDMCDGKNIKFTYEKRNGELSEREVFVVKVGTSHFGGMCFTAGDERTFRYDRIIGEIELTDNGETIFANSLRERLRGHSTQDYRYDRQAAKKTKLEVLFTGFSRNERARLEGTALEAGMDIKKSVTKNLDFLCVGPNAGSRKIMDAETCGARIVLLEDFLHMIETGELHD